MTTEPESPPAPTRQAVAIAKGRSAKGRVTSRLRKAISLMVWSGLERSAAAEQAGLAPHSLYAALRRPWVKQAYLAECEVLRVSGRARRIHRMEELNAQDENKAAAVNAGRALELMGEDGAATVGIGEPRVAGVVIVINAAPQQPALPPDSQRPLITIDEIASEPSDRENFSAPPIEPVMPARPHYTPPSGASAAPAPRQRFLDFDTD